MPQNSNTLRHFVDAELIDEARIRIEAGTRILSAGLLGEWPLDLAAEHAITMNERAATLIAVAVNP